MRAYEHTVYSATLFGSAESVASQVQMLLQRAGSRSFYLPSPDTLSNSIKFVQQNDKLHSGKALKQLKKQAYYYATQVNENFNSVSQLNNH